LEVISGDLSEGKLISFDFDEDQFKEKLKLNIEKNISILLNRLIEQNPVEGTESEHFILVEIND
ncbi:MAG: hypothetical protein IK021_03815, partial [Methanobrevibacter sp.]|nr:hypothetical protein [Methanobrevibacter sp.]